MEHSETMSQKRPLGRAHLHLEQLEQREVPSTSPSLLQSFDNTTAPALPSGWSQWSSNGAHIFTTSTTQSFSSPNSLVSTAASNVAGRTWETAPTAPGTGVQADVLVNSRIPVQLIAGGKNLSTTTPSYYAVSIIRGLEVQLLRVVNGVQTVLASVSSDAYLSGAWVQTSLTFNGNHLSVQVFRTDTSQYLNADGAWVATSASALQATDSTLSSGGLAGVNRPASYAGAAALDNFALLPVTNSQTFDTTPIGRIPAGWSSWNANGAGSFGVAAAPSVAGRGLNSSGASNAASRVWTDTVMPADIQALVSIYVNSMIPAQIFVRGSNLNSSAPSYYALSVTRGIDVALIKVINGTSVTLATLQSNVYTTGLWLNVELVVEGDQLQARVQRADTGQWLNLFGGWQASPAATLDITDNSISGSGLTGLARPAAYAGNVSFDDFSAGAATQDITDPTLKVTMPGGSKSLNGTITIPVAVQDSSGINEVEYLVDNAVVGQTSAAPYSWALNTDDFPNGTHELMVIAIDNAGNVTEAEQQVTFDNSSVLPAIPQHYPFIRIAELAYSGTPMGSFAQQLLQNSVDLVVPSPQYLTTIDQAAPSTPQLIYSNTSNLYGQSLTDWLNWADANGVSRELAFYHVSAPTPFTGTSASSQPVDWFWNVAVGPSSGTTGYTNLTSTAHGGGSNPFGSAGQSLYIGYTEMYNEINFVLSKVKQSGFTYAIEYPTAVDAGGNPTAWKTVTTIDSDTTDGLKRTGQIVFDPPPGWVTAVIPGSTARLYYVRIRTLTGTAAQAPVAKTILGDDYVNAHGGSSGVIPVYDYAADKNHTGYLTAAEYAVAKSIGDYARFAYQSRLFYPNDGQMRFVLNPTSTAVRSWAIDETESLLQANPLADGVFMDNSSGKDPTTGFSVIESTALYSTDYSIMLGEINSGIAPKWVMVNIANSGAGTDLVVSQVPAVLDESAIRAMSATWAQFSQLAASVAEWQGLNNPPSYLVLDSVSTGGAETDPRTQIATLAYYYMIGNPTGTFLMLWGGEAPSSSWTNHWFNALSYNVGQPEGGYSVFATGQDPSNPALTYKIYAREYANALVLYKPLSYTLGKGTGTTAANTSTTEKLGGSYRELNANGTLGPAITSISLSNGEGAILIKT
jgi:Bacterial Ig domain